jgi:hypothetical protein
MQDIPKAPLLGVLLSVQLLLRRRVRMPSQAAPVTTLASLPHPLLVTPLAEDLTGELLPAPSYRAAPVMCYVGNRLLVDGTLSRCSAKSSSQV